jgi:beta-lactamase class A
VELSVAELLQFMVSESDGTACDVLLGLVGGTEFVTKYLRDLGVNGVVVANTEKELGQDESVQYRNWATPEGMVVLLRALHEGRGLSQPNREVLLRLMTQTPTGLRRIKGLLPAGTVVAHKTGTSRNK